MLSFAERLVAADASRSEGQPWWTSPLHPAVLELPAGRAWPALPDEAPGAREVSVQDVLSLLPGRAHTMGTGGSRAVLGPEVPAALLQLGVPVEVVKRVPGARARLEAQAESVLTALENVERMWRSVSAARAELIAQAFAWQMLQGRLVEGSLADDGTMHRRIALTEIAGVLGVSEQGVAGLVPDAVAMTFDRPILAAAAHEGTLSQAHVQVLLEHTRDLPSEAQQDADRALVPRAAGTNRARFGAAVRRWRERHHPRPIQERHEQARADRHVQLCPAPDGMAWLSAYLPAVQAHTIYTGLDTAARAVAGPAARREAFTLDQLRADALVDRLLSRVPAQPDPDEDTPSAAGVPRFPWPQVQVQVVLTVPAATALGGSAPGHLVGYGDLDAVTTRQLLAGATCLTRVLTDPVTGDVRAVDGTSYRPPAALRRFLQTRDGTCRFPGCGRVVTGCDNDHVQDWARRGPTTAGNLLNLCRHHHRLKHLGGWSATLHPDGRATWHSPRARTYTTEPAWTPPPTPPPTPAGTTSSTRTAGSDFRDGETSADGSDALAPLPGRGLPSSLPGPDDPPPF